MPLKPIMFCSYGISKSTNDFSCFVEPIKSVWSLESGVFSLATPDSELQTRLMSVSVLDSFFEERIHNRHKRPLHQLPKEIPEPDPAHRNGSGDIQPAKARRKHKAFAMLGN